MGGFSLTSDAQPYWDDCSTRDAVALSGKNIGDELNEAGLSWGWFQGGFRPTESFAAALAATGRRPVDGDVHPRRVRELPGSRRASRTRRTRASATPSTRSASRSARHRPVGLQGRLHRTPRAVRVLRVDREPAPPDDSDRRQRRRQLAGPTADRAPTRSRYVRRRRRSSTRRTTTTTRATSTSSSPRSQRTAPRLGAPRRHVPQGAGLPGRPRGVLGPRRRAGVRRQGDRRADEDARLGEHRRDRQLRRLGRLVRPCLQRRAQPVDLARGQPHGHDARQDRAANPTSGQCGPSRDGAPLAGQQGRCGLGPRLPMLVDLAVRQARTTSTTTSATRPRSPTSSSTTGAFRRSPARSTGFSEASLRSSISRTSSTSRARGTRRS